MGLTTQHYNSSSEFLSACAPALLATRAAAANHPLAQSYVLADPGTPPDEFGPAEHNIWLSVTSSASAGPIIEKGEQVGTSEVDHTRHVFAFIMVGAFGVFACSHNPSLFQFSSSLLVDVASALANKLGDHKVPPARLQYIFGPSLITTPFAAIWASLHSLTVKPKPLLEAHLAILSRPTFTWASHLPPEGVKFGKAAKEELDTLTGMYLDFLQSGPHPSDLFAARTWVESMVQTEHLFVARQNSTSDIENVSTVKAMVGIVRSTPGVKAISLVWTEPAVLSSGLAEAFVRYTCDQTFQDVNVEQICLFVEPSNPAAVGMYARVGFSSGWGNEHWTEYGWDQVEAN